MTTNLLILTDDVVMSLMNNPQMQALVPCLQTASQQAGTTVAIPSCKKCGTNASPTTTSSGIQMARNCLLGLTEPTRSAVKTLLDVRQFRGLRVTSRGTVNLTVKL